MTFRPRPSELVSKVQLEDDLTVTEANGEVETENESGGMTKQPLYVPLRVVAVPYTEDKGLSPKVKHKRSRDSVLQELKDELSDAPIELQVRVWMVFYNRRKSRSSFGCSKFALLVI